MATAVGAEWREGMTFDVDVQGHCITVDADETVGGENRGPRPKALLLAGLAGCTGMDVVAMLRKMGMNWERFSVETVAESAHGHPRVYTSVHLRYVFSGQDLDREKIEKAVSASQEKYCAVTAMLKQSAEVSYEIETRDEHV